MAIRVTRVDTSEDFDFGPDADEDSSQLADLLYLRTCKTSQPGRELVECREHDNDTNPELASRRCDGRCDRGPSCRRVHGIFVKLVKIRVGTSNETWTVAHYDRSDSHSVRVGETDEHKIVKEGLWRASEAAGWPSSLDSEWISNGSKRIKPDVLVRGTVGLIGYEAQRSHHTIPGAKSRATRNRNFGVEPIFHTLRSTGWSDAYAVPHIRTNDLREALAASRPVQDEWAVVGGLRRFAGTFRCDASSDAPCPVLGPGKFCRKEHPHLEPVPGIRVYEVAELLPAGDIVVVKPARKKVEYLMRAADRDRCLDAGGVLLSGGGARQTLVAIPDEDTEAQRVATCTWQPRTGFGSVLDQRRLQSADLHEEALRQPTTCAGCNEPKWGIADGFCMECRWDRGIAPGAPHHARTESPAESTQAAHERTVEAAKNLAIALVSSMQSYEELLNLWRLAEQAGTATAELLEACRRRKAELHPGAA